MIAVRRWPVCNGRPERAPVCRGRVFPLCWRCAAIMAGALLVEATPGVMPEPGATAISASLAAVLLTGIDGYLSNRTRLGSTNVRRAATGLLAGAGLGVLVALV